jgi:hypothetical protein
MHGRGHPNSAYAGTDHPAEGNKPFGLGSKQGQEAQAKKVFISFHAPAYSRAGFGPISEDAD